MVVTPLWLFETTETNARETAEPVLAQALSFAAPALITTLQAGVGCTEAVEFFASDADRIVASCHSMAGFIMVLSRPD